MAKYRRKDFEKCFLDANSWSYCDWFENVEIKRLKKKIISKTTVSKAEKSSLIKIKGDTIVHDDIHFHLEANVNDQKKVKAFLS